jgi:transposase
MNKKWFIGIDISKKTLDVALYDSTQKNVEEVNYKKVSNSTVGYTELLGWFKSKKMRISQLVVCMEHTGIYGFDLCTFFENKQIDYSMLSPLHVSRSFGLVRGKNDKVDARRLSFYCYLHRDGLVYSKLKGSTVLQLRELSAEHKLYVKQAAVHKGYLTDRKGRETNATRERAQATVIYLKAQIEAIETEMNKLIESDDAFFTNYHLLLSIKGIGPVNAINTLLHTNNFQSFQTARQYACYLGIAPFGHSSGSSIRGKTRVSKTGAKYLKADLSQAAKSASEWDTEMKAYYKRKENEGKEYGTIMNAIKFKLVCRMFAVAKRGTPYVDLMKFQN